MKIKGKLTSLSLAFGLVPLLIAATAAYLSASSALHEGTSDRLSSLRDAKKQQIELYFSQIRDQVATLSQDTMTIEALSAFNRAFNNYVAETPYRNVNAADGALKSYYHDQFGAHYQDETGKAAQVEQLLPQDATVAALQSTYIADNRYPLGEKDKLDSASDGSSYSALHAKYHPILRDYLHRFGYYDIFLVDAESGHIVYSVFKELDFATSLKTGPYKDTNFADAFRQAVASNTPGSSFLVDFAAYTPSYEAPASFVASPIVSDGKTKGVLIFQMPVDRITAVLSQQSGMGESGEIYLIGADRLMRSNSRFDDTTTILRKKVDTDGVRAALGGNTDVAIFNGSKDVEVLSAYSPLAIDGVSWAILAEINQAEAFANATNLGWFMLGLTIVSALVVSFAGAWFARRMAGPIVDASNVAQQITAGNLDNPIDANGDDESAELLRSLDAMQKDLKLRIQSEDAAAQNARIKSALDSVDASVIATDTDSRIIYVNSAAQQLLGQLMPQLDDAVGKDVGDLVKGIRQTLKSGSESVSYRWELNGKTVDISGSSVRDTNGEFRGWALQAADRTTELAQAAEEEKRIAAERAEAAANTRIKVALDNVGSAVMVADTDRNIIYANKSALTMFSKAESDFRKALPNFDAGKLLGANIDQFHKQPSHQARMLADLQTTHSTEMDLGGRRIRIQANPVVDSNGHRLGTAVEWADRTTEVAVEKEIDSLVAAASAGDLKQRIDLRGKDGFFHQLGVGFNALLDQLSSVFGAIAQAMGQLADGDLRNSIDGEYQGTFSDVQKDVNRTLDNLREIVAKLDAVSGSVSASAEEIASGNSNLSGRTEQQASSLQQTAASIEQLTATVRTNADNAQQANQLAVNARSTAQHGGEIVSQAVKAMSEISASSKKIGEIVAVIDEIAFQTNLLALNASVEAARAGEQGRGFAVVATEVRNLASRSADAAKEIKDLIQDSGRKVEAGSALVNESGTTLTNIVDSVKKVGDIVAEIAAASSEQAAGIDQINQAVSHMDNMTQQNAALAEQTSAASQTVTAKVQEMEQLVGFFRTH